MVSHLIWTSRFVRTLRGVVLPEKMAFAASTGEACASPRCTYLNRSITHLLDGNCRPAAATG